MSNQIFNDLLRLAAENQASDIIVKSNKTAVIRIDGKLREVDMDPIPVNEISEFVENKIPHMFVKRWHDEGQIDFAYSLDSVGRFRINAFRERGNLSVVFRYVRNQIPTFSDLNLETKSLYKVAGFRDGIVLVCGATGSGKSSTLAALLNLMNGKYSRHIVTLEDPIEYNFEDQTSYFNQREIGIDTSSFAQGLKAALRQDPDVILIGEMRDQDTFETALTAAETGHLVLSTLHSLNVRQAVQRMFEFFPPEQQEQMRRQIAQSIRAIICQRLVPALEGGGRLPALEILVADAMAESIIREGQFEKIGGLLENKDNGSQSFNQDLARLIKAGKISKGDGMNFSPNPKALEMNLKGIFLSEGRILG